jgi:hypothetical protein
VSYDKKIYITRKNRYKREKNILVGEKNKENLIN